MFVIAEGSVKLQAQQRGVPACPDDENGARCSVGTGMRHPIQSCLTKKRPCHFERAPRGSLSRKASANGLPLNRRSISNPLL